MSVDPSQIIEDATARQREAADPSHSAWVSANAGTGKTRVLTDRIARLLLRRVRPEKILCLTYTKAAAAEMKNRITKRLGDWAGLDDSALRQELTRLVGQVPDERDLTRARRLFAATLDAPGGGVNVNTIHAFCQSLLARFPLEAGIVPHAGVMDEREAAALQREAQSRVFDRIASGLGGTAQLDEALQYLAGYLQPDDFANRIRDLVMSGRAFQNALTKIGDGDGLIVRLHTLMGVAPGETEDTAIHAACEEAAFDGAALLDAADAMADGNKTEQGNAAAIRAWVNGTTRERAGLLWTAYEQVYLTRAGKPKADRGLISTKTMAARPDVDRAIHREQDRMAALAEHRRAIRTVTGSSHLIRLGAALVEAYEAIKRERAKLDYDDLIFRALALLSSDDAVSWVHFKLDGGIDHILVDEAQDTSPPQWDIIRSLSLEMFAGRGTREDEGEDPDAPPARTVFAVGDEKQSIYSFQGADPRGFAAAGRWFQDRATFAGKDIRAVELIQSFRTTKPVLDAVDAVFASNPAREGVALGETDIRHVPFRFDHAGAIELWPAIEKRERADENPWLPIDEVRESTPLAQTAERIARTIRGWLDDQVMLPSVGRPINAGDIMILVERRTQFAEEMVKRLKHYHIDVAGSDRMKLTDQMAVMDLMATARMALLIDDDLTLATVLKGPFIALSEDELYALAHNREGSLWRALTQRAETGDPWRTARDIIAAIRARADTVPPFEFFSGLLSDKQGRRRLYARLGNEAGDPIDEFLDLALQYERTHPPSLQGFLQWVESGANEIKRDMEVVNRAIRVMTVHGAKGLEAPIVILPDTCGDNAARKTPAIFWLDDPDTGVRLPVWPGAGANFTTEIADLKDGAARDNTDENHRLLYVAMTRARDRLHVTGWERGRKAKDAEHGRKPGSWYELIRPALEEMPTSETFDAPGGEGRRVVSPQVADPDQEEIVHALIIPDVGPEPWMQSDRPAEPEPSDPLTPSRPSEPDPAALSPFADQDLSRFRRGQLIHRLLQTLPELSAETRHAASTMWLLVTAPDLAEETRDQIRDETLAVLTDPDFADLFAPGSLAEVPIAGLIDTSDGKRAISGQIDRLAVSGDAVSIIDYKTNRPPPLNENDVAPAYLKQMAAYRAAVRAIYPGKTVRCVLLWTDGPRAMTLSDNLLDSAVL